MLGTETGRALSQPTLGITSNIGLARTWRAAAVTAIGDGRAWEREGPGRVIRGRYYKGGPSNYLHPVMGMRRRQRVAGGANAQGAITSTVNAPTKPPEPILPSKGWKRGSALQIWVALAVRIHAEEFLAWAAANQWNLRGAGASSS